MSIENYFQIEVMPVRQTQTGLVFLGKISFEQLLVIHRLTERIENWVADPFDGKKREEIIEEKDKEFQRQLSKGKLRKICEFLKNSLENFKKGKSIELFPTSIILSLDHDAEYDKTNLNEEFLQSIYSMDLTSCFISEGDTKIFIPKNKKISLIVDGQHRFYGVKEFYDSLANETDRKLIKELEFIATFLIGFDVYELGRVFATVNFEQKPVNRSLYYDIFGSMPETERNDIKLAHDLALHLNNNVASPIKNMIKMLGRGYGLFSQAFFVENMLVYFKEKGVWEKIYTDYLVGGKEYSKLPIFMNAYLSAIKESYKSAWPHPVTIEEGKEGYSAYAYDYILCKTTGMGAFFRLIKDIYPLIENKLSDVDAAKKEALKYLSKITDAQSATIFSKDGEFGKAGSLGLQQKLYQFLKSRFSL